MAVQFIPSVNDRSTSFQRALGAGLLLGESVSNLKDAKLKRKQTRQQMGFAEQLFPIQKEAGELSNQALTQDIEQSAELHPFQKVLLEQGVEKSTLFNEAQRVANEFQVEGLKAELENLREQTRRSQADDKRANRALKFQRDTTLQQQKTEEQRVRAGFMLRLAEGGEISAADAMILKELGVSDQRVSDLRASTELSPEQRLKRVNDLVETEYLENIRDASPEAAQTAVEAYNMYRRARKGSLETEEEKARFGQGFELNRNASILQALAGSESANAARMENLAMGRMQTEEGSPERVAIDEQMRTLERQNNTFQKVRQAVVQDMISGRINPQGSNSGKGSPDPNLGLGGGDDELGFDKNTETGAEDFNKSVRKFKKKYNLDQAPATDYLYEYLLAGPAEANEDRRQRSNKFLELVGADQRIIKGMNPDGRDRNIRNELEANGPEFWRNARVKMMQRINQGSVDEASKKSLIGAVNTLEELFREGELYMRQGRWELIERLSKTPRKEWNALLTAYGESQAGEFFNKAQWDNLKAAI